LKIAILELYCGNSGKLGFYNSQEVGIAKAYARQGNTVLIVYPQKDIDSEQRIILSEQITVMYIPAKAFGVHSFYNIDFLIKEKFDLVHLDSDNQIYAPYVMKFCKKHNISFYNYVGTLYSDSTNILKKFILDYFSRRNIKCFKKTRTFVKTQAVLSQLKAKGVNNATVVPVGLDLSVIPEINEDKLELREKLDLPKDKKIVLFVGRLSEYKRPLCALEILNKLSDNYYLVIIGTGEMQSQLINIISRDEKISKRVTYIEKIPNKEIHKYYKTADCFVNFNDKEIFGMSILEAMYQECPVVAIHAPGPDEIINDTITGYLCNTVAEMSEKIVSVDKLMGIAGKERILKEFSWDKSVEEFLI